MPFPSEFEAAVGPYLSELRAYCRQLASSKWDAEDLYQESLLRTFEYYRKSDRTLLQPRPLLYKVARNLWIDRTRKLKSQPVPVLAEAADRKEKVMDYADIRGLVEWMAELLEERELSMLFLAAVYQYSYKEIAEAHRCTVPAVRMALHRSKLALRSHRAGSRACGADHSRIVIDYWTNALIQQCL